MYIHIPFDPSPKSTLTKEISVIKWMRWQGLCMLASVFPQPPLPLPIRPRNKSHWRQRLWLGSAALTSTHQGESLQRAQTTNSREDIFFSWWQHSLGRPAHHLNCRMLSGHLPHNTGSDLFSQKELLTLKVVLPFPPVKVSAKISSVNLPNASFTIVTFHTILLRTDNS